MNIPKWREITVLISVLLSAGTVIAAEHRLSIEGAVSMALKSDDPYLNEPAARAAALKERAVADGQLPDPKVSVAFANWPTNTFNYSQESMTQVRLGVSQAFPRGDTRRLKRERRLLQAEALRQSEAARRLAIILKTRQAWLDLYYWQAAIARVNQSREAIAELIAVTQLNFATGKNKSQDIFRAEMELALLDDRLIDIAQKSDMARARLSRRIGVGAVATTLDHPTMKHPSQVALIKEMLSKHPSVEAEKIYVEAAGKEVSLAGEQYKPGWSVAVGYGARGGQRADFASVGVTMDVPLFTKNRQDRQFAAAKKMRQAKQLSVNALLLDLERQLGSVHARWLRSAERIALYKKVIRERAKETSAASLSSYRNGVTDFPELVRARLAELEVELKLLQLEHQRMKAQAELLFLEGEDNA